MLKMIRCDSFGAAHKTIEFNNGLNSVLGSEGGSNAIGKSTLLLIIDFCFGGDSYIKLSSDVFKEAHVGHHRINFVFRFDETDYYFSRLTNDDKYVSRYNSEYKTEIKKWTAVNFRAWLREQYNLEGLPFGMESICGHFFRVSGRNNANPSMPLYVTKSWEQTDFLMALIGNYEPLKAVKDAAEEIGLDVSKLFSSASKVDFSEALGKIEFEKKLLYQRLIREQNKYEEAQLMVFGYDPETDDKIRRLREELKLCGQRRSILQSQFNAIKNNAKRSGTDIVMDFEPLLHFFPNVDIVELSKVEHFHQQMGELLKEGIETEITRLKPMVQYYDKELERLQSTLAETNVAKKILEESLVECVNIKVKIAELDKKKVKIEQEQEAQRQRAEAQKRLNKLITLQNKALTEAQEKVTAEMRTINNAITLGTELPPHLWLSAKREFDFRTPDNRSDGTACKSLVIFDLAMLVLSPIPAIAHDTNTLVHIEIPYLEKILEYYNEQIGVLGKQVFIALDKADKYSPMTQDLLANTACVHLSDNAPLYGVSWSKKAKTSK